MSEGQHGVKELEGRLSERSAELLQVTEELDTFLYSVSHDLRSPLGAILNFAAILEEDLAGRLSEEERSHLERIRASAASALAMMEGLLVLSRVGREPLRRERVDMDALAREVFAEVSASAPRPGTCFSCDALPPVEADAQMMRVVWSNLLGNALKYAARRDPPRIHVSSRRLEGAVEFRVEDNGAGFDPRYSERLFRPFQRLHSDEEFRGVGVGLAVVARAVRRHGGSVRAEAEVGRGATFRFALPLTPPAGDRVIGGGS